MRKDDLILWGFISIGIIIILLILFFKFFAPQSGIGSRFGGSAVELEVPSDCVKILSFGRSTEVKYISYINIHGEIILKEYSDWGMLEAEYKLDAKFDNDFKLKD